MARGKNHRRQVRETRREAAAIRVRVRNAARNCPCGKRAYRNEQDAADAVVATRGKAGRRVYFDEQCNAWHITSQRLGRPKS